MIHNFQERLSWSQKGGDEPFWDQVYRKAFHNFVGYLPNPSKNEAQFRGVDRLILLSNDVVLRIDEKKREREWGDILLEYISVDTAGKPGWIEKDLAIDYLAYAFMETSRAYLFPWQLLRRAWRENGNQWKRLAERNEPGYRICKAKNQGYCTVSVAVPINSLLAAINRSGIIEVAIPESSSSSFSGSRSSD